MHSVGGGSVKNWPAPLATAIQASSGTGSGMLGPVRQQSLDMRDSVTSFRFLFESWALCTRLEHVPASIA